MSLSDVQICANALIRLGAQPIQSFTDGTDTATICASLYPSKARYMLSRYPWRFSMKYVQLSKMTEAPTAQYRYQYTLPSDRVFSGAPVVYPSSTVGALPIRDYTILGNVLLTDVGEVWVQYQYDVDESLWPPYFTELMINVMKLELTLLITENGSLYEIISREIYGTPQDQGTGGLFGEAMYLDSRDNPTISITDFSLIEARLGGIS